MEKETSTKIKTFKKKTEKQTLRKLPEELIGIIYEYDGRYKKQYNLIIRDINLKNDWYELQKRMLVASMEPYEEIMSYDYRVYLHSLRESTFSGWYFGVYTEG